MTRINMTMETKHFKLAADLRFLNYGYFGKYMERLELVVMSNIVQIWGNILYLS